MKPHRFLVTTATILVAGFLAAHAAQAGEHCRRPDPCRGIAILSPLESPDACDSPVGGCYRWTPYYPGYSPDRRCLVLYGQTNWAYSAPSWRAPGSPADYGALTGASRDEATLLRLGGNGAAPSGTYRPGGNGDLLDRMHGFQR